jgi:hypothetical protein
VFQGYWNDGYAVQSYLNHSHAAASDARLAYSFDANALNPSQGTYGWNNYIGTRTLTNVSGNIWKIGVLGTVNYKIRPLIGWVGINNMKDISGPSADITVADDYSFCHVLRAGETCGVGGAQVGDTYLKALRVLKHPAYGDRCLTSADHAAVPCIISAGPGAGWTRQFRSDRPDVTGVNQRLLTFGFRPPGTHGAFWGITAHPAGTVALIMPGGLLEGNRPTPLVVKLPQFPDDTGGRNSLGGTTLRVGRQQGFTHIRAAFGYTSEFKCTARDEQCLTDAAIAPFAFAGEPGIAAKSCAAEWDAGSDCTLTIPFQPGRLGFYRLDRCTNATSCDTSGDITPAFP